MADEDRDAIYIPTSVQVDRARMQGLGVGARDLDGQREPTDELRLEQRRFAGAEGGEAADGPVDEPQAGPPGAPDQAYDERYADEVSFTQPSGGAGAG
jgi:hypothetical protein